MVSNSAIRISTTTIMLITVELPIFFVCCFNFSAENENKNKICYPRERIISGQFAPFEIFSDVDCIIISGK